VRVASASLGLQLEADKSRPPGFAPAPPGGCPTCARNGGGHVPCLGGVADSDSHPLGFDASGSPVYGRCPELAADNDALRAMGLPTVGYGHGRRGNHCRTPGIGISPLVGPGALPGSVRGAAYLRSSSHCRRCKANYIGQQIFCERCTLDGPDPVLCDNVYACLVCNMLFTAVCRCKDATSCVVDDRHESAAPFNARDHKHLILDALGPWAVNRILSAIAISERTAGLDLVHAEERIGAIKATAGALLCIAHPESLLHSVFEAYAHGSGEPRLDPTSPLPDPLRTPIRPGATPPLP